MVLRFGRGVTPQLMGVMVALLGNSLLLPQVRAEEECQHQNSPNALTGRVSGDENAQFNYVADCERKERVNELFHKIENLHEQRVLTAQWLAAHISPVRILSGKDYCVSHQTPAECKADEKAQIDHGPDLQWHKPAVAYAADVSRDVKETPSLTARLIGWLQTLKGKPVRVNFVFTCSTGDNILNLRAENQSDSDLAFVIADVPREEWERLASNAEKKWVGSLQDGFQSPRGQAVEFRVPMKAGTPLRAHPVQLKLQTADGEDLCAGPAVICLPVTP